VRFPLAIGRRFRDNKHILSPHLRSSSRKEFLMSPNPHQRPSVDSKIRTPEARSADGIAAVAAGDGGCLVPDGTLGMRMRTRNRRKRGKRNGWSGGVRTDCACC